jgi:trimeric autotransporter adhesin
MTTQYTTILKLALPVQGELSGTWGDVVNDNITQMVEQAVAGKAVVNTWTGNSHTLTTADGTTSESRCAILELTDSGTALTGAGTVVCPTNTKLYIVDNNTAEIITVQTAAGTGVAVPVGKTMLVYCDGTNVVEGVTHANSLSLGTSTVTADKILDEDNMASDSATAIATQQSIKAYVDSQVGTVDTLSEILANGNTTGANDIDVDSAQKVQFRDAAIYINSSVDGQLDIVADGEVQIDTALVDINGNLDVSGTTNISGSVSFTKNAIAGVAISTTSRSSNTVTVTTSAVHGLTSGDLVNVNGVADTSFNGYFTASVSSTTVFTYSQTGADGSSTGGTSTEVVYNLNASGTALNWMNGPLNIAANSGIDGLEITQSGAGNGLHVTGTTGLVGNTTLTGDLDVSGTTLVTGVLTTTAATVFNGGFASNADSTLGTDKKVQFRDSAIYINSSVDGQLDIVADTEIQIAATTIDIDGAVDMASTLTVSGQTIISADALVATPSTYYDELVVQNSASGTGAGITILVNATNGFGGVKFGDSGNSNQFGIGFDASTNNGFLDVSGSEALRIASDGSLSTPTAGTNNVRFGVNAGNSIIAGGNYNTVVGDEAGTAITTGDNNVLIGAFTGDALTTGTFNVAVGTSALGTDILGNRSVAVGNNALTTQNPASAVDMYNVAVGYSAGAAVTTGVENTLIGGLAGDAITTGGSNTAVGTYALTANTTAGNNTAVGIFAMGVNTTGQYNTAVGGNSLDANTTGDNNTAVGRLSLSGNTTASNNTAVGTSALFANTEGTDNTAVGTNALAANTTANFNTAIGRSALAVNTTGYENLADGAYALAANTTGSLNTAVGISSLAANTTASNNTAVGNNALGANTTGTANVAVGYQALDANTTAAGNNAVGSQALSTNTTGASNIAIGQQAMFYNTTGSNNTAIGHVALGDNTTADNNTAVGYFALNANTTGDSSTAVGKDSMKTNTTGRFNTALGYETLALNTTGANNVALGKAALYANTTADNNTAVGFQSLTANTTGTDLAAVGRNALTANTEGVGNTAIGDQAGYNTTTGDYNTFLGKSAHADAAGNDNCNVIGYNVSGASGYTTLGITTDDIRAAHGVATWATVSDERYKKDIVDSTAGLSFINALQPRTFKYKTLGELPETFSAYEEGSTKVFKNANTNHGFIAQEIKAAIDADNSIKDGFKLWDEREDGSQEVAEAALIPVLVKAIQELTARIEALES